MNQQPNYTGILADVNDWATRRVPEGNIKQLVFPSRNHREAVQIANFLRQCGYSVTVKKHSEDFQEIIITKPV